MFAAISRSDPVSAVEPEPSGDARILSRYRGGARVSFTAGEGGRVRIADLRQASPCRVAFPRQSTGDPVTAVFVTTSGGLAGGDSVTWEVASGSDTSVLATTQAAEKIYRTLGPETEVLSRLSAGPGAWLEWLPQETILFDRARLRRRLELGIEGDARVLAAESVVLGRTAFGERFREGLLHDEWRVRRGGRLVWADALHLEMPAAEAVATRAGLDEAVALGTLIYVAPDAAGRVEFARAVLDRVGEPAVRRGATAVSGLLVVRLLSPDAQALRAVLAQVVGAFRAAFAGLPARAPAMWGI